MHTVGLRRKMRIVQSCHKGKKTKTNDTASTRHIKEIIVVKVDLYFHYCYFLTQTYTLHKKIKEHLLNTSDLKKIMLDICTAIEWVM